MSSVHLRNVSKNIAADRRLRAPVPTSMGFLNVAGKNGNRLRDLQSMKPTAAVEPSERLTVVDPHQTLERRVSSVCSSVRWCGISHAVSTRSTLDICEESHGASLGLMLGGAVPLLVKRRMVEFRLDTRSQSNACQGSVQNHCWPCISSVKPGIASPSKAKSMGNGVKSKFAAPWSMSRACHSQLES
jgi:hypothetical protein